MALTILFLCSLFIVSAVFIIRARAQFNLQYLGYYVPPQEEELRDFCESDYCLSDANDLFYSATQNASVLPCDDFKEFALGSFIKFRALNDRYQKKGFLFDVSVAHWGRWQKVLKDEIDDENDVRIFKIMKNYFKNFVDADHVVLNGTLEVLERVNFLGGSPYISEDSWNPANFNLTKLLELEPFHFVWVFLDQKLTRCENSEDPLKEILCFKVADEWSNESEENLEDVVDLLKQLDRNINGFLTRGQSRELRKRSEKAVQIMHKFFKLKKAATPYTKANIVSKSMKVKELNNLSKSLKIDWLKIINDQLLRESKIYENETILIKNFEVMKNLLELLVTTDVSILAETFALTFLYHYRDLFIVYTHDRYDQKTTGRLKAVQRWENCIDFFYYKQRPALESLYAQEYHDEKVEKAAKEFAIEGIEYFIDFVSRSNLTYFYKLIIVDRLKTVHFIIGTPAEVMDTNKLEEFYKELNLKGDENLLAISTEIQNFYQKIKNEPKLSWRSKLNKITKEHHVTYYGNDNILYIGAMWLKYPFYHPDRPRFFNTATLFTKVIYALNEGVSAYLKSFWNLSDVNLGVNDNYQIGYEYYVQWKSAGGQELQLSANYLTNNQLYWQALARYLFAKYHPGVPLTVETYLRRQQNFLHVWLKHKKGFQEAFDCKMSEEEQKKFEEYKKESGSQKSDKIS